MDNDIIELLTGVSYTGDIKPVVLAEAINNGPKSAQFRQMIAWITNEIRVLGNVDEQVNHDADPNDFLLELSGFLKEMQCPFADLVSGPLSSRFQSVHSKSMLLDYLLTELMAMKMLHKLKPSEEVVIEMAESPAAAALKSITIQLNVGKPPDNIAPKALFEKINTRLDEVIRKAGPKRIGKPLFTPAKPLTEKQWKTVQKFQKELDTEYDLRRQMLITRLDVTVQSFQWSDKIHGKEDTLGARYTDSRKRMEAMQTGGQATDIVALLAAREDIAIIEKTSSANVRKNTGTNIQKHVMGGVPDRGGRAYEHAPPPPEMPSWQQRSAGGDRGGRGGSGGGGGGGGGGGRGGNRGGGFSRGGTQPQRQIQQQQGQGYPPQSSGYQPSMGYQQPQSYGGNQQTGGHHNYDNRGSSSRVQGGWSQSGPGAKNFNNDNYVGNSGGGNEYHNNRRGSGDTSGRGRSSYNRGGGRGQRNY